VPEDHGRHCDAADAESPAKAAGLGGGDKIVAVNGVATHSWQDVTDQLHKGQPTLGGDSKPTAPGCRSA